MNSRSHAGGRPDDVLAVGASRCGADVTRHVSGCTYKPRSPARPWRDAFEADGYATVAGSPDDPGSVGEGRAHPEVFAGKNVKRVTDHMAEVIGALTQPPVVIGHSFGG